MYFIFIITIEKKTEKDKKAPTFPVKLLTKQ